MKERLTCIVCPVGCDLQIESVDEKEETVKVSGAGCKRGEAFATTEIFHPMRMVSTVVNLAGGALPCFPVISTGPVPKEKLRDCISLLQKTRVTLPLHEGDVIIHNILDTQVDIVAAKTIEKENEAR